MSKAYKCPRCGNTEAKYIGYKNGEPYCRKCILFYGEKAPENNNVGGLVNLDLSYSLSKKQQEISNQLLTNYINKVDSLVNAVCGSGKTEIVFQVISYALTNKKRVGFAIPRRDVVIELYVRLKNVFKVNSVVAVYGGSTSRLTADIVVLTTHQLYRYDNYFDLLILDEIDAFPFKGNDLLYRMFKNAVRGNSVLMSATPSSELLKTYKKPGKMILELNTRYHGNPLPVPKLVSRLPILKDVYLIRTIKRFVTNNKQVLIFVPTIYECEELYSKIRHLIPGGYYVHSKLKNRPQVIKSFKHGRFLYLITTAVLERGVTIKNLQVIVFNADSNLYDEAALVQIAGRVGRKKDAPEGEVLFIATKITNAMENARRTIESKNKFL